MPAKAILRGKNSEAGGFSRLSAAERVSLKKFSVSFVLLQAAPVFLVGLFVAYAGVKHQYFSVQTGLLAILGLLIIFYFIMPRMADKVIAGIMALRSVRPAKAVGKGGV